MRKPFQPRSCSYDSCFALIGAHQHARHTRRVYERLNPCLKDPLLPGRVQNTPLRASEMKTKEKADNIEPATVFIGHVNKRQIL